MSKKRESCPVCDLIKIYELNGINEELKERYEKAERGTSGDIAIAHFFNERLLENVVIDECSARGQSMFIPTSGIPNFYDGMTRMLESKHVSASEEVDITTFLMMMEEDIVTFSKRFATNYNVVKHLTKCLKAKRPPIVFSEDDFYENAQDTFKYVDRILERLKERMEAKGMVPRGDFVYSRATMICNNCGRRIALDDFIKPGFKCECQRK